MAKLGEGDERWIVKERDDGRNVNAWHWSARAARRRVSQRSRARARAAHWNARRERGAGPARSRMRSRRGRRAPLCTIAHERREERDQTEWAKKRLREMLGGLTILDDATGSCKITAIDSITGEVTLQSRKQRRFAIYELDISLKWEGQYFDADGKADVEAKGTMRIEDLSEETLDGMPCDVTCDSVAGRRAELKELVRTKGAPIVKAACLEFVKELKALVLAGQTSDEAGADAAAAVAAADAAATKLPAKPPPTARANNSYVTSSADSAAETAKLEVEYTFPLNASFVYESLLDANRMRAATAADASIDATVGGDIRLFNGSVEGKLVELVRAPFAPRAAHCATNHGAPRAALRGTRLHAVAPSLAHARLIAPWASRSGHRVCPVSGVPPSLAQVPGAKIVQKWRFSTWQPGHFSDVTITLAMDGGNTKLRLVQTGVPVEERDRTEKGWRVMIFDRLKMVLGGIPP